MLMHKIRLATIGFVALMFGVVQVLCACSAQTTPMSFQTDMVQSATIDAHAHNDMAKHEPPSISFEHHHNQGHDHNGNDCAHCSGDLAFASSSDGASASKMAAPSHDIKTLLRSIAAPNTPANLAPSALGGLRWLDPPRPTLISQKVLLLI
jgi:hypothetical protein